MKLKISMFVLPQEIDLFENTLIQLKKNSHHLDTVIGDLSIVLDVTFCMSPYLHIPQEPFDSYLVDKFNSLARYVDWCEYVPSIEYGDKILGCVSKRREASKDTSVDVHLWMDCDLIFNESMFYIIKASVISLSEGGIKDYIITPEIVKIWDHTWDVITGNKYLHMPLNYNLECDPFFEIISPQSPHTQIQCREIGEFKFAGGWMTVISDSLLKKLPIPESLGHYGLEDWYIMEGCRLLKSNGVNVIQCVLEGLIVCENHAYRDDSYLIKQIQPIDRKDEFRKIAHANIAEELQKLAHRIQNG